jgi:KAT8 regulatory NSL complex subunit 1
MISIERFASVVTLSDFHFVFVLQICRVYNFLYFFSDLAWMRMSSPLTLRLCCLVAMAPALTSDLASQVRGKVSSEDRPQGPPPPAPAVDGLNGGNGGKPNKLIHIGPIPNLSEILRSDNLGDMGTLSTPPAVNGDVLCRVTTAASSSNGISSLRVSIPPTTISLSPKSPKSDMAEMSTEVGKKQKVLETRQERLLKRLRRLESRQAISHVKQQMSGFVMTTQQSLQATRQDFKNELLHGHDVKNLSTAALVNLVQKLQASQSKRSRHDSEAKDQLHLEEETCLELDRVAGHLQSNLRHLEKAIDSDATESSSGGESCDEMDLYDEEEWADQPNRPSV